MANKLSEQNKAKFYDFIISYENEISEKFGIYNINSPKLKEFCETNKILIGLFNKRNNESISRYNFFILWNDRKPDKYKNIKGNNSAHNFLRHIKNSMAHGNIIMENRQKFSLTDYNDEGTATMTGKISASLFFKLTNQVLKTFA